MFGRESNVAWKASIVLTTQIVCTVSQIKLFKLNNICHLCLFQELPTPLGSDESQIVRIGNSERLQRG